MHNFLGYVLGLLLFYMNKLVIEKFMKHIIDMPLIITSY